MKRIRIRRDRSGDRYYYKCPFCGVLTVINARPIDACEHLIYSYEDVNSRTLGDHSDLYDEIAPVLKSKPVDFLQDFHDIWTNEFDPGEEMRAEDPEAYEEALDEALDSYLNDGGLTVSSLIRLLRYSSLHGWLKDLVVAETDEDPEGFGKTYYVLHKYAASILQRSGHEPEASI